MNSILLSASIMGGLSVFCGTILAVAYRFLRVAEDPRLEGVYELLPGSNCGACGEPGCRGFAEQLVAGVRAPSRCTVSSPATVAAIAKFLGVDPGQQEKRVARVHCAGGKAQAEQIAEYHGLASCRAAMVVTGGGKGCAWGCLGLADCVSACTFGAIQMNANGLPVVAVERCTACGACVSACPRDLLEIIPLSQKLFVQCQAPLSGPPARALCAAACDACGRCAADAPLGLIHMVNNLPVIDYAAGGPARPEITYRCPTQAIQWLEGEQFAAPPVMTVEVRYAQLH